MPKRRCENCSQWSSTDSVWGTCTTASSSGQWRNEAKRPADLETRADFGCVEWRSLAAVVRRIEVERAASATKIQPT